MKDHFETRRVRITGRVQGVSFRAWTRAEAERLGLTGWVRNEADGSVRALIAGPRPALEAMVERLWEGPPAASVTSVRVENAGLQEAREGFEILR